MILDAQATVNDMVNYWLNENKASVNARQISWVEDEIKVRMEAVAKFGVYIFSGDDAVDPILFLRSVEACYNTLKWEEEERMAFISFLLQKSKTPILYLVTYFLVKIQLHPSHADNLQSFPNVYKCLFP